MNNSELTDIVRRCQCVIPKDRMKGSFCYSPNLSCTWYGSIEDNRLEIEFPDYLSEAPCIVITDLTKKIIQNALYDSDYKLSDITRLWLITNLHTPENTLTYIQRNGFKKLRQFNDATVVQSEDSEVDWSVFFRVISIPREQAESPELDSIIAETYDVMVATGEQFLEA